MVTKRNKSPTPTKEISKIKHSSKISILTDPDKKKGKEHKIEHGPIKPQHVKPGAARYSRFSRYSRYSVRFKEEYIIRPSLFDLVLNDLDALGRSVFYQRIFMLAKNKTIEVINDEGLPHFSLKSDLKNEFEEQIKPMIMSCHQIGFMEDNITGLFVCMEHYSFLVVESSEEMLSIYCSELLKIANQFWDKVKIFQVEDNIEKVCNFMSVTYDILLALCYF